MAAEIIVEHPPSSPAGLSPGALPVRSSLEVRPPSPVIWLKEDVDMNGSGISHGASAQQMEFTLEGHATLRGLPSRVWPARDLQQTEAMWQALDGVCDGMSAKQIAAYFRGGKRTQDEVSRVLAGFFRMGLVYMVGQGYRLASKAARQQ